MAREIYGTSHAPVGAGAVVTEVAADSDAAAGGIRAGDRVLSVDGIPIRDILDWRWHTEEPAFTVRVDRAGSSLNLDVSRTTAPLGVSFTDILFDGVHECDNACTFCFVAQLPKGLRPSLYVRDDDYRLSFLNGTFITLTNLSSRDLDRIVEQRLTPLYVSLHAVDADVRRRLICPSVDDHALGSLDFLLERGITTHVQIVLVPGVNDGAVLDRTLGWLSERDGVESVGVVPLGYTAHQSRFAKSYQDPGAAAAVLDALAPWQERRDVAGGAWVQAADEFYINAGRPIPSAEEYGEFPQYENGIGLVRAFMDDLAWAVVGKKASAHASVITGELFAPVLREALDDVGIGDFVDVLAVGNRLLGGGVSVTGLLGGAEIVEAVKLHAGDGPYLVPDVVVNSDGLLLDDTPAGLLSSLSGRDVRLVPTGPGSIVDAVCGPDTTITERR